MKRTNVQELVNGALAGVNHAIKTYMARAEFYKQVEDVVEAFIAPDIVDLLEQPDDAPDLPPKYDVETALTYSGLAVTVTLRQGQSINEVKELARALARMRMFEPATYNDKSGTSVMWSFNTKEDYDDSGYTWKSKRSVQVIVVYKGSGVCAMQETGNMIPEMKLVCSDGVIVDQPDENTATLDEGTE